MIKTVSFAPPRSNSSRPTAKSSSPRSAAKRVASGSSNLIPAQTSLDFSDESPVVEAIEAKPVAKIAPKTVAKIAPKAEVAKAEVVMLVAPQPKVGAKSKLAAKAEVAAPEVAASLPTVVPTPISELKAGVKPKAEVKTRKPRVPKDLATQYGESPTKRPEVVPIIEPEVTKKRLNKAERLARRELIKPDEGLLARLARASQVAIVKPKSVPRGKGWRFECGRCGQTSFFETPGGLCPCGTIAVKDRL